MLIKTSYVVKTYLLLEYEGFSVVSRGSRLGISTTRSNPLASNSSMNTAPVPTTSNRPLIQDDTARDASRPGETPVEDLTVLQEKLRSLKKRNDVLDNLVVECRRMYGDNLTQYPPEVSSRALLLQSLEPERSAETIERDRNQSEAADELPAPRREKGKHMIPPEYEGRSQKELTEYLQACNRDTEGYPTDTIKIKWAATLLRKEPANAWERFRKHTPDASYDMIWEGYKEFLANLQLLPVSRRVANSQAHENARQRPGQLIREFVNYLEEREGEKREPFTERQLRDILFNKIRPEARQKIAENGQADRLQTRDQVISAVALQETYTLSRGTSSNKRQRELTTRSIKSQIQKGRTPLISACIKTATGETIADKDREERRIQMVYLSGTDLQEGICLRFNATLALNTDIFPFIAQS
ncbi:uncharacterized protein RAG0_03027 [Rhynchosporium agropyri]|uniref:Uncharacterized protein n=1 Tax=Rhynchosporium agropyri TaxID=914238 RepID=A0A1E1K386_9HELO|nr:uncharacterized protein RAG0_03027 [Rhynchosporium agropyri]